MSVSERQLRTAAGTPYNSLACRVGTHAKCDESVPTGPPVAPPLVYETCVCPCHQARDGVCENSDKGEGEAHG